LTTFTDARVAWAMRHANPPERAWTEAGKGHFHRIRCSTIAPTSLPVPLRPGDGKTHHESKFPGHLTEPRWGTIAVCSTFRTFRIHLSKSRLLSPCNISSHDVTGHFPLSAGESADLPAD
jgi:hypothetical protein